MSSRVSRSRLVVAVVLATLVLAGPPAHSHADEREAGGQRVEPSTGTFLGVDGRTYDSAPQVVDGLGAELFYGPDFDVACGIGKHYRTAMVAMTKLTRVIERSGRRAIWTVGPDKTSVLSDSLDRARLPHGGCDRRGFREQRRLLDAYDDPTFLHLRPRLAADSRQVYFRTDPHWTSVGGAVFAKELARTLDPRLARRQRFTLGTETRLGLFSIWRDQDAVETLPTARPDTRVRSRTTRRSVDDFTAYPDVAIDHSWTSTPARRTWPGRTLVLGDSMALFALENLRPVFRHGRFMWVDSRTVDDLAAAVVDADTVVLEVLQAFLPLSQTLPSRAFRRAVADALRRDRRQH